MNVEKNNRIWYMHAHFFSFFFVYSIEDILRTYHIEDIPFDF